MLYARNAVVQLTSEPGLDYHYLMNSPRGSPLVHPTARCWCVRRPSLVHDAAMTYKNRVLTSQTVSDTVKLWEKNCPCLKARGVQQNPDFL
jgi:hypothetical protein